MVASSPFPGPSRLRRSLARSRETHFTRPNRRACSQAKIALVSVHRLTEQLYAMSTLKSRYNDLSLRVEFCTSFSFIYNTIRQRQTRPQPVQKTCTSDSVVLISHTYSRQPKYKHKGWGFPQGIYSEIYSPNRTLKIISMMALTLQPIRGRPQHSGETGTRLLSAIHRRLFSRFFLREGGRQYTGYSVHASCDVHCTITMQNFLMSHLMGDANPWQQLFLFPFEDKYF